ncbi:MAG: hypothetical protein JWN61_2559 [Pseudonocardiales bacterium]|nr:hypothetical protein [Pseudonocardiales bacterium]
MARGDLWLSTETSAPRVAAGRFSFGWERLGIAAPEQEEFWKKSRRKRSYAKNAGGLELVALVDPATSGGARLLARPTPVFWLGLEAKDDRELQIVTANPARVLETAAPDPHGRVAVRLHVVADPDGRLFVRET